MAIITCRAAAVCVIALMLSANAEAQSSTLLAAQQSVKDLDARLVMTAQGVKGTAGQLDGQQTSPERCRRGRRAFIGGLIGFGAAAPLARLAHTRFENEAANGAAAAATTLVLGAAAGALIGLATCNR